MQHDAVRVWTSFIKKLEFNQDTDEDVAIISDSLRFYPTSNDSKLRYTIEFYDSSTGINTEIYNKVFDSHDTWDVVYIPQEFDYGDKVFFRVHKSNGANDILKSNPSIIYDKKLTGISENNFIEAYNDLGTSYAKDFLTSSQEGVAFTSTTQIKIDWNNLIIPLNAQPGDIDFIITKTFIDSTGVHSAVSDIIYINSLSNTNVISPTNDLNNIQLNLNDGEMYIINFEVRSNKFIVMENNASSGMPVWKPKITNLNTGIKSHPIVNYNNFSPIKFYERENYTHISNFTLFNNYFFNSHPTSTANGVSLNILTTKANLGETLNGLKGKIRMVADEQERVIYFNNNDIIILNSDNTINNNPITIENLSDIAFYADSELDTKLLFHVRDSFCFDVWFKESNQWISNSNYSNCYNYKFPAYGKQSSNLGANQMGWGQFFYNDEFDDLTPIGPYGYRLINNNILNDPSMGQFQNFGINESNYDENSTSESIEEDISNALGVPQNGTDQQLDDFLNNLNHEVNLSFPFLPATPKIYITNINNTQVETSRWEGLLDSQFMEPHFVRAGGFEETSFSQIFSQEESTIEYAPANVETGMFGIIKETVTKSKSNKSGLFVTSRSSSSSNYSHLKSDFIDLNGDGYPDRVFGNYVQYTTMTGGHSESILDPSLSDYPNSSINSISGTTGSFPTAYHKAKNEFKSDVSSVSSGLRSGRLSHLIESITPKIGNNSNEKASPFSHSITLNDTGNKNEIISFHDDLNGDGLLDKINLNNFKLSIGRVKSTLLFPGIQSLKSAPSLLNFGVGAGVPLDSGISEFAANETLSEALNDLDLSQASGYIGGVAPSSIGFNLDLQLGISGSGSKVVTTLQDINGDGLQDLLFVGEEVGMVSYNLGNKFAPPVPLGDHINLKAISRSINGNLGVDADLYYGTPLFTFWVYIPLPFFCCIPVPVFTLYFKSGLSATLYGSMGMNDTRKSFMDFDGDGFVDFLEKEGDQIKVYLSQIKTTNKLKSVSNSLGKQFEVDYELVGNTYDMPMSKWVMSDVYYFSGNIGNEDFSVDSSIHDKIEYRDGYYDRRERQLYGFEKVSVKRSNDQEVLWTIIDKYFNKSYYLNGLLSERLVAKGNQNPNNFENCSNNNLNWFSCRSNQYNLKKITNGLIDLSADNLTLDYDFGGTKGRGIAGVELKKSIEKLYQYQANPIVTTTEFQLDEFSRVVRSELVEEGNISRYDYPDENNQTALFNQYAISEPYKIEIFELMNGQEIKLNSSETIYESNNSTSDFLMPKTILAAKGNHPLEVQNTMDLYDENANVIQISNKYAIPTSIVYGYDKKLPILTVTGISYDDLENLISISSLQNSSNNDVDQTTETSFRNDLHHAISTINNSSIDVVEIKAFTYDENIGVTSEINGNGLITYYEYDSQNRLSVIKDTDGNILKEYNYETVGINP